MKRKSKIFLAVTALVCVVIVTVIVMVLMSKGDGYRYEKHLELAQKYIDELNYEQAIAELQIVIQIEPNNVTSYLMLAEVYTDMKDYENAVGTLVTAAGLEPDNPEVQRAVGSCEELLVTEAEKFERLPDYAAELKTAAYILQLDSASVKGNLLAGNAAYGRGETGKALEYYEEVLELDKENREGYEGKEKCEIELLLSSAKEASDAGELQKALDLYRQLLGRDEWNQEALAGKERCEMGLLLAEARKACATGNAQETLKHYAEIIGRGWKDVAINTEAYQKLAETCMGMGDYALALEYAGKGYETTKDESFLETMEVAKQNITGRYIEQVRSLLENKQYKQAVSELESAIQADLGNSEIYLMLAEAYLGMGDEKAALAKLAEGCKQTQSEALQNKIGEVNALLEARAAKEEAERKAAEEAKQKVAEETARKAAEKEARKEAERKAAEEKAARKTAWEEAIRKASEEIARRAADPAFTPKQVQTEMEVTVSSEEEAFSALKQAASLRVEELVLHWNSETPLERFDKHLSESIHQSICTYDEFNAKNAPYLRIRRGGSSSGEYYEDMIINIKYFTTVEEEQWLDLFVAEYIKTLEGMSDYKKVETIHDFLCERITYDNSGNRFNTTAYEGIALGSGTCASYATGFQRIAEACGLNSRIGHGHADYGEDGATDIWNVVMLDGQWYHLDATRADGITFIARNWFLLGADRVQYICPSNEITLAPTSYQP